MHSVSHRYWSLCSTLVALGVTVASPPALRGALRESPPAPNVQTSPQAPKPSAPATATAYKERVSPHWFSENTRFWYRNQLPGGTKEFITVDALSGTRQLAFDHAKLATHLAAAAGLAVDPAKLPFDRIAFLGNHDSESIAFRVGDITWKCSLSTYECARTDALPALDPEPPATPDPRRRPSPRQFDPEESDNSRDGQWASFIKDHNVFLRSRADGKEIQLTADGKEGDAYGRLNWSPDSKGLAALRIQPGDRQEVHLIESSPKEGGRAKVQSRPYPLPGDRFTSYQISLFNVADGTPIPCPAERIDFGTPRLRWRPDGRHFTYEQVDRGHQRFRLIEIDAHTGAARNLIDEKSDTFIWTAHTENLSLRQVNWIEKTGEIIYVSERDGWRHLYLVDTATASMSRITQGEWVVRGIDRIDEEARQIWFHASGKNPSQDPYFIHYYRVNFDGSGLVALTDGNGTHTLSYSPDRKFIVDTYSRVDAAPIHELRQTADGTLVGRFEEADLSELRAGGWTPPEVFSAKGRDGATDIWGIICRPRDFNPGQKYPVIEEIYAGPQGSFVPKSFSPVRRYASLTDLGFIVVKIDGMGTANRSKAFHDICYKNLKDAGFPDRMLWMKAAAARYPELDLERVGIYGHSAGAQNAAGALLFHPSFYKVAVASCGCHDNRMDKASWNEQWMGYPVGPQYAESSNIENAHRLRGRLFLIVGELDTNVPPESTLRFAGALIRAQKDFDMLVIPGAGHSIGGAYGERRRQDFFVRHLLGVEPPDRNTPLETLSE